MPYHDLRPFVKIRNMSTVSDSKQVSTTLPMEKKINAIEEFVAALKEEFPNDRPIVTYARLLERGRGNQINTNRQVQLFRNFLMKNKDGISCSNPELFVYKKLVYADKIYIDLHSILTTQSEDVRNTVWQHLYALNLLFFPSQEAKNLYKQTLNISQQLGNSTESLIIEKTFDKIQGIIPSDGNLSTDPGAVLGSLFASGAITDLMGDMQRGVSS